MFLINFRASTAELLTTVKSPDCFGNFLFQEGFLVYRWLKAGDQFIGFRKVPCTAGEVDEEAVVNVGHDMVHELKV